MADRLGLGRFPVYVTPVTGLPQQKLLARLDLMQRELAHVQTAIADMKRSAQLGPKASLEQAVINSRNWTLSIAMSHAFIQQILLGSGAFSDLQLNMLFDRAVNAGKEDGERDRKL